MNSVDRRWAPRKLGRLVATGAALAACLGLSFQSVAAQAQGTVTGEVTAADSGQPIPSATVLVQGTELGVLTNASGRFTLQGVPAGSQVIEARSLGYRAVTQTVDVTAGGTANVSLTLAVRPLEVGGIQVQVLRPDLAPQAELTDRQVREANPKDSGELLRALTGVDAVRRGPLGLDPVVRGLRETEVGTYLDGTRQFPAGPARMDSPLTHLDPSAVQNIEVVKGPYALTWGAGNLSAIRVETAPLPSPGDTRPRMSASTGYDSNIDASEASGMAAGRSGPVSFWAHGAWRDGSNYEPGGGGDILIPGAFHSYEGRGKVGFDVGDNSLFSFTGGYQDQGPIDYPGRLLTARYFYASNFEAQFETNRTEGTLRNAEFSVYRNKVQHQMDNGGKPTRMFMASRTPPFGIDVLLNSKIQVWGGRAAADLVSGPWTTRIGADFYDVKRFTERWISRLTEEPVGMGPPVGTVLFDDVLWPHADIADIGAFARVGRTLDSGIRLAGTLRLDQVSADAKDVSADFLDYLSRVTGSTAIKSTETNVSGALTAGLGLSTHWDLSLGLGSAVRTADASERYSDHLPSTKAQTSAEFMGDPSLKPERSTQGDIWLEGSWQRAALQVNLFARKVSDYITVALTDEAKHLPLPIFPPTVYRYVNGDATFWGGEVSLNLALSEVLTGTVGGSYLWGRETSYPTTDGPSVEEPAYGVAPPKGTLGLRYEDVGGRYFLEGTGTFVAKQTRVAATRGEERTPGYGTLDLLAGVAPLQGINLRVGVQNVFNKFYVNHLNSKNPYTGDPIPEPGRVMYMELSYGVGPI